MRKAVVLIILFFLCKIYVNCLSNDEDYFRGVGEKIAVVVSTRNDATFVTSLLESVEESIEEFLSTTTVQNKPSIEVIIADDNSSDKTPDKIGKFISEKKKGASTTEWRYYGFKIGVRAGAGTCKNYGVQQTNADVLFFADTTGFFKRNHIKECYEALISSSKAYVKTGIMDEGISVVADPIPGEDYSGSSVSPINMCIWKRVHEFVEGFPEQGPFESSLNSWIGYQEVLKIGFPVQHVAANTISDFPGPPEPDRFQVETVEVKKDIINYHISHLQKKLEQYQEKGATEPFKENVFWAIYKYYIKEKNAKMGNFDARVVKYQQILMFGDRMFESGKVQAAKNALNVVHLFLYDAKLKFKSNMLYVSSADKK